jgi:trimethylamine--corrinoid protein Co-methyltransferase
MLDNATIRRILDEAIQLLDDPGVRIHSERALALLDGAGARIDRDKQVAHIPSNLVERCLETVPRAFALFDTHGTPTILYAGDVVHFDPGSAAIEILDYRATSARAPVTRDLIRAAQLADRLPEFDAVSTCLVPSDVPEQIGDLYRLLICLTHSSKPIITGAFGVESWKVMHEMLIAVRGDAEALREKPLAVFDVCLAAAVGRFIAENLMDLRNGARRDDPCRCRGNAPARWWMVCSMPPNR